MAQESSHTEKDGLASRLIMFVTNTVLIYLGAVVVSTLNKVFRGGETFSFELLRHAIIDILPITLLSQLQGVMHMYVGMFVSVIAFVIAAMAYALLQNGAIWAYALRLAMLAVSVLAISYLAVILGNLIPSRDIWAVVVGIFALLLLLVISAALGFAGKISTSASADKLRL